MLDFLVPIEPEHLERQIFDLMYSQQGSGLNMAYETIMKLPTNRKNRLVGMLYEQLEAEVKAAKGQ